MNSKRYQTYKDSEVKWLGNIPKHWETCVVKRVAKLGHKNFVDGDWIESPYITDKGIRLIQTGNVGIGIYKEKGWRYISEKTFNDLNCTEIFPDDVLICRLDGPVGRACLVPDLQGRMITSVDNTILKPSKDFDSKFIVYVMSSSLWLEWTQALCRVGGGFRFRISRSMLGELRIQKPPLSEQEAIAYYLDTKTAQIDRKIDLLTHKAALYGDLKQSLINETVTRGLDKTISMKDSGFKWLREMPKHWRISRIKDEFLSLDYKRIPLSGEVRAQMTNPTYDYYGASGIIDKVDNYIFDEPLILIGEDGANLLMRGSPLAFIARGKYWVNNHAHILKPKRGNLEFLCYLLESIDYTKFISGSAQPKLTAGTLSNVFLIVPPLSEQKAIADYLDTKTVQIEQIILTINTQIEKLKELRKTLINDVVTGKIKVV